MLMITLLALCSVFAVPELATGPAPGAEPEASSAPIGAGVVVGQAQTVRGQILDQRGDPLASFVVELSAPDGASEILTTDEYGQFVSTVEFAATLMFAYPRENGRRASPLCFENLGLEVELRFDVGEPLELQFALPAGKQLSDFTAYPVAVGQYPAGWLGRGAAVRAGQPPWVRFSPGGWPKYEPGVHGLFVRSADGLWGGRIPGPIAPGEVSFVHLESLGVLRLTLRPPGSTERAPGEHLSRAMREPVRLSLQLLGPEGSVLRAFSSSAQPGVELEIECLQPGRWRIETQPGSFEVRSTEVTVVAGQSNPLELLLDDPLQSATLVLRVVDSDGDIPVWKSFAKAPDVSATVSRNGRSYSVVTWASCGVGIDCWFQRVERDGRTVLEAELLDLTLGDYEVELKTGGRCFEGPAVVRPGEPAVFVLSGSVFGFRVTDALSGKPVEGYRAVEVGRRGQGLLSEWPDAGGVHARDVKRKDLVDWCISAPGYQRAYGSVYQLDQGPDGAWADVVLERGWAVRLEARTAERQWAAGVEGALGETPFELDRSGRVLLVAPLPPTEPRITFEGWEVVEGDLDAEGRFDLELDLLRVTLRPL